jgi:hypothetical protein
VRGSVWVLVAVLCADACSTSSSGDAPSDAGAASMDATLDARGDVPDGGDEGGPYDSSFDGDPTEADGMGLVEDADAGPVLVTECPTVTPDAGVACDSPGLWCEYGGGAHERCSTSAYCGRVSWSLFPPDPACTLTNAVACPSTYGVSPDASCPLTEGTCDYDAGRCACVPCTTDDAGQSGSYSQWFCRAWSDVQAYADDAGAELSLPNACPANRPLLGTACDAGFECGYDACYGVSLGPYEWCSYGTWGRGPQTDLCNPPSCH